LSDATLPTVKLRDSDPDYWETRLEWNTDSLCTRMRLPVGNSQEFVYHGDLEPDCPTRHRGDLIVARQVACCTAGDLDGDGLPLTLATRYTYDPRFGSPARFAAGPRQSTSLDGSYSHGRIIPTRNNVAINIKGTGADKNRIVPVRSQVAINTKGTGADKGRVAGNHSPLYDPKGLEVESALYSEPHFVTKITCPNGTTDTAAYSAQGNRIQISHQGYLLDGNDTPVRDIEVNSHGQIIAIVNPADANGYRRRDEFTYFDSGVQNGYCATWVVDAAGPVVSIARYDYDALGNMTTFVNPRGQTNRWIYNQLGDCVRQLSPPICDPCGPGVTDYIYDANGSCVRVERDNRDANGVPDPVKPTWTTLYTYINGIAARLRRTK